MKDTLLGFEFIRPAAAIVLVVAPVVLVVAWFGLAARARARRHLVSARNEPTFLPRYSENRARLRVLFAGAALFFLGLGLVGPVRGYTLRDVQRKGLDIVVSVDTSRSMLVQDVKPDRLTRAKREVAGLLAKLRGDRAALLAFAGDVREVAPLTHDRATLTAFVQTLNTEENLRGGTDLGVAMEKALSLFDGRTGAHEAIVLLTDGEDNQSRPLEVAEEAARLGVRVYTVGIGSSSGEPIQSFDENGNPTGFVKDEKTGEYRMTRLDEPVLQEIAKLTGGRYVKVESDRFSLDEVRDVLEELSRTQREDTIEVHHDEGYAIPVVAALVLLCLGLGLPDRRRSTP